MTAQELRQKFLKFFESKEHRIIPSAPLVPENDPTVLFTTAGMHPLVPYLLGQPHPLGRRLTNVQACIRTGDIEEVGDETHLTFFEMLGNWSLSDYFKKEAIEWSFEFLTKELNLPIGKLAISVFAGEPKNNIPADNESAAIWQSLGITKQRIAYLCRDDNWWGPAGKTGPCGPDTEMFFWTGREPAPERFDPGDKQWVEIWNDVFMQFNKTEQGKFEPLAQKNVDTGMGLERTLAVLNNKKNLFETELFLPILEKIRQLTFKKDERAERIIADHIKAVVFILAEGVLPSNIERGYVLRRLIRRAVRFGKTLGTKNYFLSGLGKTAIDLYKENYPELERNKKNILSELEKEEEVFGKVLEKGMRKMEKMSVGKISGKDAFDLYQTYGFPIEMTKELAREKGIEVDERAFCEEMRIHQEISRTASAGQFKSGLADSTEQVVKHHTATHLLLAALRRVLGEEVKQMGSNITAERIRFDFACRRKMTGEEIKKVEDLVNEKIRENLTVKMEKMPKEEALKKSSYAAFPERYPDVVSVYSIFDIKTGDVFSCEICGGPHAERTGELGKFKIIKEESSCRGVRRVKAVLQ